MNNNTNEVNSQPNDELNLDKSFKTHSISSTEYYGLKIATTIFLLLLFYPAGVACMWVWTKWKTWVKVLITILPFIIAVIGICVAVMLIAINPEEQFRRAREVERFKPTPSEVTNVSPKLDLIPESKNTPATTVFTPTVSKYVYPADQDELFIKSCVTNSNYEFCSCLLNELQNTISFDDLTKAVEAADRKMENVPVVISSALKCVNKRK